MDSCRRRPASGYAARVNALLAATEPVTPRLFVLVVVLLLVKVTIDLAGRTHPVWRSRSERARARPAALPAAPRRPAWFDAFAQDHARRTPPSYWARMLADLLPLKPTERDDLLAERESGARRLVHFLNIDDDRKNNSA